MAALSAVIWSASRPEPLQFEPWQPAPALRTLPRGAVTPGVPTALIGLDRDVRGAPAPPANLCAALFDESASEVPVAFFTDHYCPNCRSMATKLQERGGIEVTRHELPILGSDSVVAARAALAAGQQNARDAFHARMRRAAFALTEAYLRDLADSLELDVERLIDDLDAPEVSAALREDTRLAASLGFAAVPVTVVGRTVIVGDISTRTLDRLVEEERRTGPACPIRR